MNGKSNNELKETFKRFNAEGCHSQPYTYQILGKSELVFKPDVFSVWFYLESWFHLLALSYMALVMITGLAGCATTVIKEMQCEKGRDFLLGCLEKGVWVWVAPVFLMVI